MKIHVLVPEGTATKREHECMVASCMAYYIAMRAGLGPDFIAKGVPPHVEQSLMAETKRFGEASFAGVKLTFEE